LANFLGVLQENTKSSAVAERPRDASRQ